MRSIKAKVVLVAVAIAVITMLAVGCPPRAPVAPTPTKLPTKYTHAFSVEYIGDGCKKVIDGEGQELILVPRGKKTPEGYEGLTRIDIPVKRGVFLSTTEVCLLRPLGVLDSVIGVTTEKERWYIEEVKRGMEEGRIKFVGKGMEPDYEAILALKPDVVFSYTGLPIQVEVFKKIKELGIPIAIDNEWLETHPLGRLEWIKFLSAFYDKEDEASDFFDKAERRAVEIFGKVFLEKERPDVIWGSIWMGKVYVPASDSYVAKMISLAGGDYLFPDLKGVGSANITLEEFYARANKADIFIYSSCPPYINSIKEIIDRAEVLRETGVVKEGKVWCFQPWYWQSIDKTDEIIEDLASIFYPSLFPDHKLRHFMRLPAE